MLSLNNLYLILFVLPIYQMMYYTIQLLSFKKKKNRRYGINLGILVMFMFLYLVTNTIRFFNYYDLSSLLYLIQIPLLLAVIPTYFLFVKDLISPFSAVDSKRSLVILYSPSVFILIANIINYDKFTSHAIMLNYTGLYDNISLVNTGNLIFIFGNIVFVLAQIVLVTFHYRSLILKLVDIRIKDHAKLPYFEITWSHMIYIGVLGFVICCALMNLLVPSNKHILSAILNLGILISGNITGYFILKQNSLYKLIENISVVPVELSNKTINEHRINFNGMESKVELLCEDETKEFIAKMQHHFINEKPYLNSNFSVSDLIEILKTTRKNLNYVINQEMGSNFYGIVNKYRVLEAKELFARPENDKYNIEVISEMVGFKSKSSFNACFKEIVGSTPSEYRKNGQEITN